LRANSLYINVGDFVDNNPSDGSGQIHSAIGGEDLWSFENLGQVSSDYNPTTDKTTILYRAEAKFGFEVTAYTTVGLRDVDPSFSVSKYETETYLWVDKFDVNWNKGTNIAEYKVGYYAVDFNVRYSHEYNGQFPITIGLKDLKEGSGELVLGDYTFDMITLAYDVRTVKCTNRYDNTVGDYEDIYVSFNAVDEGYLSLVSVTEQTANQEVMDFINQANIGWKKGNTGSPITLQNYKVGGTGRTETCSLSSAGGDLSQFNLETILQPEITETRQYNTITWAKIWWDYDCNILSPCGMGFDAGPSTMDLPRRISAKAINRFMHWGFEADFDLYTTVVIAGELSESELADPDFSQGDWVWDDTWQGDIPTLPEDTTESDILGIIWSFIFIIIAIFVIIVFIYLSPSILPVVKRGIKSTSKKRGVKNG